MLYEVITARGHDPHDAGHSRTHAVDLPQAAGPPAGGNRQAPGEQRPLGPPGSSASWVLNGRHAIKELRSHSIAGGFHAHRPDRHRQDP